VGAYNEQTLEFSRRPQQRYCSSRHSPAPTVPEGTARIRFYDNRLTIWLYAASGAQTVLLTDHDDNSVTVSNAHL